MAMRDGLDVGRNGVKLILLAASIALMCVGCILESGNGSSPGKTAGRDALRGEGDSNEPASCSKVWSPADADSILYCPELLPPSAP
jgi:hypothetical protein